MIPLMTIKNNQQITESQHKPEISLYWFMYCGYEYFTGGDVAPRIPNGCDRYLLKNVRFDKDSFGYPAISMLEFSCGDKKLELYTPVGAVIGKFDLDSATNGVLPSMVPYTFVSSFFETFYPKIFNFMRNELLESMQHYTHCYIVLSVEELMRYSKYDTVGSV